jgi:hypothetical protein
MIGQSVGVRAEGIEIHRGSTVLILPFTVKIAMLSIKAMLITDKERCW